MRGNEAGVRDSAGSRDAVSWSRSRQPRPASAEEGLRLLQAFRAIGCVEVRSSIVALAAREAERYATKAAS